MILPLFSLVSLLSTSVVYAGIITPKSVAVRQYGGGYGPPSGPPSTPPPASPPPPTTSTTAGNPSTNSNSTSSSASGLLGDRKCGSNMCVTATVSGSSVEYLLSSTRQVGWMAMGFGEEMVNTPIVLMWGNADGSVTLSQRRTSSYTMPTVDSAPAKVATLVETSTSSASSSEFRFTVEADSETTQNIVYAYSRDAPSSSAVDARISIHQEKGMFTLDLSKPLPANGDDDDSSETTPLTNTQKLFVAHAVFCGLGFLFLLPSGVLLARFFRTFTPTWFKGHWFMQFAISGPVILIGFALGIAGVAQKGTLHFAAGHKAWGLVLIVLYLVQCSLGAFIHFVKSKTRIGRPPQNYGHAVLGLAIISIAFYQVRTGYMVALPASTGRETPGAVNIVWIIWLVLLVLLYAGGLAFLPKQWRQEKQSQLTRYPSDDIHKLQPRQY